MAQCLALLEGQRTRFPHRRQCEGDGAGGKELRVFRRPCICTARSVYCRYSDVHVYIYIYKYGYRHFATLYSTSCVTLTFHPIHLKPRDADIDLLFGPKTNSANIYVSGICIDVGLNYFIVSGICIDVGLNYFIASGIFGYKVGPKNR